MTITGIHASFQTTDAKGVRDFLRDVMGLRATDIGGGFLVFDVPDAEVAAADADAPSHDISFSCDDIQRTVADLNEKGVRFVEDISEEIWGWRTWFEMPGELRVMLYQPKYARNAE